MTLTEVAVLVFLVAFCALCLVLGWKMGEAGWWRR